VIIADPIPICKDPDADEQPKYSSTLYGPTCDSGDLIVQGALLPEMSVGDWLYFKDMGAYTMCFGCKFNGFPMPRLMYHVSPRARYMLTCLPNWPRIAAIVDNNNTSTNGSGTLFNFEKKYDPAENDKLNI
jgi:hypothetical protein